MRLFLAVNCPEQLRRELTTRVDLLRASLASGDALRWVDPAAWHLTLQFLGDWPEHRVPPLESALAALQAQGAFALSPGGLGAFPKLVRPRVLFLHMESGGKMEELAVRVRKVVHEVWPEGPQDNKQFKAHLTLARVKGRWDQAWSQTVADHEWSGLTVATIKQFDLISSVLLPEGAQHQVLQSFSV